MIDLRNEGFTFQKISEKLGLTYDTVYKRLNRKAIKAKIVHRKVKPKKPTKISLIEYYSLRLKNDFLELGYVKS